LSNIKSSKPAQNLTQEEAKAAVNTMLYLEPETQRKEKNESQSNTVIRKTSRLTKLQVLLEEN